MGASLSRTATLTIDAARVSPSRSIAALARAAGQTLVVVTGRAYGELVDELGSDEAAARHLAGVATKSGKPLAVNFPTGPDTSRTLIVGPKGWTEEKTAGWVAVHHEALERTFGPATPLRLEDL